MPPWPKEKNFLKKEMWTAVEEQQPRLSQPVARVFVQWEKKNSKLMHTNHLFHNPQKPNNFTLSDRRILKLSLVVCKSFMRHTFQVSINKDYSLDLVA